MVLLAAASCSRFARAAAIAFFVAVSSSSLEASSTFAEGTGAGAAAVVGVVVLLAASCSLLARAAAIAFFMAVSSSSLSSSGGATGFFALREPELVPFAFADIFAASKWIGRFSCDESGLAAEAVADICGVGTRVGLRASVG